MEYVLLITAKESDKEEAAAASLASFRYRQISFLQSPSSLFSASLIYLSHD